MNTSNSGLVNKFKEFKTSLTRIDSPVKNISKSLDDYRDRYYG